jgi:hypothetical protein
MKSVLIAPCGMNCNLCKAYLRDERKCPGCRLLKKSKNRYIRKCIIRNCSQLKKKGMKFCSDKCEKFPCQRLKNLDKRYRTKYGMSMTENLNIINKKGIKFFLKKESKRWKTPAGVFCVHDKKRYALK